MARVPEDTLWEMTDLIVKAIDPVRIILFGSQARGLTNPQSDIDLLVVVEGEFGPERNLAKETGVVYRLLSHILLPKDILLVTEVDYGNWKDTLNHVIGNAVREGTTLYERHG